MSIPTYDEVKGAIATIVLSIIERKEKLQVILQQDYTNRLLKMKLEEMDRKISNYTEQFRLFENTDRTKFSDEKIIDFYQYVAKEIIEINNNFDLFCMSYNV